MNVPSIIASRYRVVRELGRGGMGVVYLVEHVHTGDHLALKLLLNEARDPETVERFKREARASAKIKSENVVKVVDADTAPELGGAPFLVMELLNGRDLQKQLELTGPFAAEDVAKLLTETARALDKSHAIGIIHRDLKPENLFVHAREDGTSVLKILDFGISKVLGPDTEGNIAGARMTATGQVMGTPYYMSPEQARGRMKEVGPWTDAWAIGLIAVQLLTGEIYWRAHTVGELMAMIIADPLYKPSERWPFLPPALDAWFFKSLARDPAQRFQRIGEQVEQLAAILRNAPKASGMQLANRTAVFANTTLVTPPSSPSFPSAPSSGMNLYASPSVGARTTGAVARDASGLSTTSRSGAASPLLFVVAGLLAMIGLVGVGVWYTHHRSKLAAAASAKASSEPAPSPTPAASPSVVASTAIPTAEPTEPKDAGAPTAAPVRSATAKPVGDHRPAPQPAPAPASSKPYAPAGL